LKISKNLLSTAGIKFHSSLAKKTEKETFFFLDGGSTKNWKRKRKGNEKGILHFRKGLIAFSHRSNGDGDEQFERNLSSTDFDMFD